MPTELPSSSNSIKITRTNSEENLKYFKRSASYAAQEPGMIGGLFTGDFNAQLETFPPPPLSPQRQNLPMKLEVEWNKKVQLLDIGLVNLQKLKEIVATAFSFDYDFISKMCLDVVLEYYHNGKFEHLTESNVQIIYHGNGKLRIVIVDDSEGDDE